MSTPDLADQDYRALAALRHQMRRFIAFSEAQARAIGLEPRQHQVLLALRGLPEGTPPTVGALAERLILRHHTVVGLLDRLEQRGLVQRRRVGQDRRQVQVAITVRGRQTLRRLSLAHRDELAESAPALLGALRQLLERRA
jgi:DNA-binding MarR family transcriptional regulator